MRKQLLLIIAASMLASTAAWAGEPAVAKKVGAAKFSQKKRSADEPRLFRDTITLTQALEPPPAPGVDGSVSGPTTTVVEPIPMDSSMMSSGGGIQLYDCVKYKDLDNIHPCAVTKIVAIVDPCQDPCNTCGPQCVYVQICVPPCECVDVKTSHGGRKVKYDYGKYEVEIKSKNGVVEVDYDHGLF